MTDTLRTTIQVEEPYLNLELTDGRHVFISADGRITVRQPSREVSPGMYDMGGKYELTLPDAAYAREHCSERDIDPTIDLPYSGTFTIPAEHIH